MQSREVAEAKAGVQPIMQGSDDAVLIGVRRLQLC
jgi:hypothetical protein